MGCLKSETALNLKNDVYRCSTTIRPNWKYTTTFCESPYPTRAFYGNDVLKAGGRGHRKTYIPLHRVCFGLLLFVDFVWWC